MAFLARKGFYNNTKCHRLATMESSGVYMLQCGDPLAKAQLMEEIYRPLVAAGPALLNTVATFLEQAGSLEATARMLFVHPNTVRYRLRRVVEITGALPTSSRSAFTLRIALTLGRLEPG